MATHELTFPIAGEQEILELRAGDEVTVQGHIIGIRDRTQIRIFDEHRAPPMDLRGAFLLHTAPNVRKIGERRLETEDVNGGAVPPDLEHACRDLFDLRADGGGGGRPHRPHERVAALPGELGYRPAHPPAPKGACHAE